jgi:hypothetical protein
MRRTIGIFWGILLIGGGTLLLLQNLGYLGNISAYLWSLILGVFGLSFLIGFLMDRTHWWALIPGVVLLSVGTVIGLSEANPELSGAWSGPIILGGVGLAFWLVYLMRREFWWSLIPAGTLTTLAVVAWLGDRASSGLATGAIFFIGLAVTFGLVFLATRMKWALIPAAALAVLGLFIFIGLSNLLNYLWPIALIAGGLFLLYRVWRPARQ